MTASVRQRNQASLKRQRAWELHIAGVCQYKIADELGVTEARVSQMIKEAAARHPVVALDLNERIALSEARWQLSEDQLREQINFQRVNGRVVTETFTDPEGKVSTRVTHQPGVDPALLRALSTHHDRRARQLNNQLAPDTALQQVNVSIVKDFLSQGQAPAGKLSAAEWNESATIDV
jgi:predicted transcriptional regulator